MAQIDGQQTKKGMKKVGFFPNSEIYTKFITFPCFGKTRRVKSYQLYTPTSISSFLYDDCAWMCMKFWTTFGNDDFQRKISSSASWWYTLKISKFMFVVCHKLSYLSSFLFLLSNGWFSSIDSLSIVGKIARFLVTVTKEELASVSWFF